MPASTLHDYLGPGGRPVSLEEMLDARDKRAAIKEDLLREYRCPVLSMTLNMPGRVKRTALSSFFFDREKARLLTSLKALGVRLAADKSGRADTGDESILAVEGLAASALKSLTLDLEEGSGPGRLLDLDVLDTDGCPLGRAWAGLEPRKCLICGQPAQLCAASRAHPPELLQKKVEDLLLGYACQALTDLAAGLALEASSFELMVAPKPGLVTPCSAGSHTDMDRFTFIRSQAVLAPYYRRAFQAGWEYSSAARLRMSGIWAEAAMEAETAGVNTHRGWIYLSGILLFAAGRYSRAIFLSAGQGGGRGRDQAARDLMELSAETARDLEESLEEISYFGQLSKNLGRQGRDRGIRGEAIRGFPSIFHAGLPVLAGAPGSGADENTAGLRALLAILAVADDSTLIRRGGPRKAELIKAALGKGLGYKGAGDGWPGLSEAALALSEDQLDLLVKRTVKQFADEDLSCGGAADLLAGSRLADRFLRACTG
ncbi:MAG: citrate lyase holo-[acyl-carrier protein] synthase [Desulfobulbaceae bacterium]